jgi:TRAP transporter TAXI family solute receptor
MRTANQSAQVFARTTGVIPAILLALLCTACAQPETPAASIKIGSGALNGIYDNIARSFARVVNDEPDTGLQFENLTTSGSVENINALSNGDIQFGIAQADQLFNAVNGLGQWTGTGSNDELRSILGIYTESVTLVAGGNSGIRSIEDLKGMRVAIGLDGSGTQQNAIDVMTAAGINLKTEIQIVKLDLDDQLEAFIKEEIDAFFFTAGHPNTQVKFATYSPRSARLIDLADIATLTIEKPYYTQHVIALGTYPRAQNTSSTHTVGVRATLLTSTNVPDDVVYTATKTVFENAEKFKIYFPQLAELRSGDLLQGLTAPIHPGALKYFLEAGLIEP